MLKLLDGCTRLHLILVNHGYSTIGNGIFVLNVGAVDDGFARTWMQLIEAQEIETIEDSNMIISISTGDIFF